MIIVTEEIRFQTHGLVLAWELHSEFESEVSCQHGHIPHIMIPPRTSEMCSCEIPGIEHQN